MTRLLILGNAGLDITLSLPRLPRLGETLVGASRGTRPGGKGLNQAIVARRVGLVPVEFLAPLGDEAEGARIAAALHDEDFAALHLPRPGPETDCSVVMVMPDGENSIVTAGACAASLSESAAIAAVTTLPSDGWLLIQGNLRQTTTMAACVAARARGVRVIANTAPLAWDFSSALPFCAVAVANADEAEALTGCTGAAAASKLRQAGAGVAIVTRGAQGCVVAAGGDVAALSTPAVRMVDSTGAGDTFCGVLAASLAAGWALRPALAFAQEAAALSVQRPGCFDALPSAAELACIRRSLDQDPSSRDASWRGGEPSAGAAPRNDVEI